MADVNARLAPDNPACRHLSHAENDHKVRNREMDYMRTSLLMAILLVASSLAPAIAHESKRQPMPPDPADDPLMMTAGFLSSHPDLRYRLLGLEKYKEGNYEDALRFFQRASYYADKPSQGMVAEFLWDGKGTQKDRAMAYAWMDLAAERGYRGFLKLREEYWDALSEEERARSLQEGQALYTKYGDAAAKPRIATTLRRERKKAIGSRTGYAGNLQILVPGPEGDYQSIDGSKFYDERYWDPELYQAWHDSIWTKPRTGTVSVGDIEQTGSKPEQPAAESRVPPVEPQIDAEEPESPDPMRN